ncbi:MAG TPA: dephospho-CoA kinase [Acidobacteriaceae bacterium]
MLRVGLTGDLGSGKSTVARMLGLRGAVVFSSDEMGRELMKPGNKVYDDIAGRFGKSVITADGSLSRNELSKLAFAQGRVEELNEIVHPAVIAEQQRRIEALAKTQPHAITVVESALIFVTKEGEGDKPWRKRFDRIVLVTAPETLKIARFIQRIAAGREMDMGERAALEVDARNRLALQSTSERYAGECTVLRNDSFMADLERRVEELWQELKAEEAKAAPPTA